MYIIINELLVNVQDGWTILQACLTAGFDLPRFCYHEKLSIAGNCRMCLVETNLVKKLVIACATPVVNKMVVYINSLRVKKARESILEFLLANHPLDCPICDQGGECDLQDLTFLYGNDRGRFYEVSKRSVSNKYFGEFIKTYMVRCIHCTRCVRFLWEVCGMFEIGVVGRGVLMEISNYIDSWFDHELSGNIIDLCPVGALTSKPFSFIGRFWEFSSVESLDFLDGLCSNIKFDLVGHKVVRVLPGVNNRLNEDWISNKIRFFYDSLYLQRLLYPMLNIKLLFSFLFGYCMIGWDFCFRLLSFLIVRVFKLIVLVFGGLYELSMVRRFKELFLRIGYRFFSQGSFDFRYYFLNVVVDLFFLGYSFFLIVGNNVRFESPIIMSRLRRIFFLRRIVVFLLGLGLELLTFLVINIGNSFEFFIRILEYLYIRFFCVIQMLLILGTNFIYRSDWSKVYYLIYLLCAFGVIYVYIHYTFIFLHFFEFGLQFFSESGKLSANGMERFIYLIGSDEIRDTCFVRESFVAYQGGYGETGALFALVIIPVKIIFEVTGYFINTIGMVLDVNECLDILGNLLKDDEIFFLLGEYIGWEIYVYGFFFLLFEIFLFMGLLDCWHIFKNIFFLMIGWCYKFYRNSLFFSSLINYYANNVICRMSKLLIGLRRKISEQFVYV